MAHEVDPYADKLIAITRSMRKIQNTFDQLLNEQPQDKPSTTKGESAPKQKQEN